MASDKYVHTNRRKVLLGVAATALATAIPATVRGQQKYPTKPVKVIVPFPPGGNADSTARIFTEALSAQLGQPFVVENKGGAGGMIGAAAALKSEADGYTLLCATPGPLLSAWQLAGKSATYGLADMRPVAMLTLVPNVLVVSDSSPVRSFSDLVSLAKSRPKDLKCGHPGNGTTGHVNILQLQRQLNTEFIIAAYKGGGPVIQDLLAGQLDLVATDLPSAQGVIKAGRLRAIAVISGQRAPSLPDVPTTAEAKAPEIDASNFTAIVGPKNMPPEAALRIAEAVGVALGNAATRKRIDDLGSIPAQMSTAEFERFLAQQSAVYASLIQSGLLRAQ